MKKERKIEKQKREFVLSFIKDLKNEFFGGNHKKDGIFSQIKVLQEKSDLMFGSHMEEIESAIWWEVLMLKKDIINSPFSLQKNQGIRAYKNFLENNQKAFDLTQDEIESLVNLKEKGGK